MRKPKGINYKGGKSKMAKRLIDKMIEDSGMNNIVFVDVFGGGGSMTIEACKRPEISNVIYNELDVNVFTLFKKACLGEITLEDCKPLSREEFYDKNNESLMKLLFSFGSCSKSYYCSKEKSKLTYSILNHYYNKANSLCEYLDNMYLLKKSIIGRLSGIEPIERVNSLRSIHLNENLDKILFYNLDYKELPLNIPNAIYYFDPPYEGTSTYPVNKDKPFSSMDMYNLIKSSRALCYVSELEFHDEQSILDVHHVYSLGADNNTKVKERLFKINS